VTRAAAVSKTRQAYDWIRQRIADQELTPGHRLVLATIAAELNVSVVPVREAIRQLEAEGLVTYEHNVGARVCMVDVSQYRDSMQTLSFLEGAATALSARNITMNNLRQARAINARMASQLDRLNPHVFTKLNKAFHSTLFQRCPNPRLLDLVKTEWSRLGALRDSTFSFIPERARESVREHENIITLIQNAAPLGEIEMAARGHRTATLDAFLAHEHADEIPDLPVNF
jgi:DNA-binding GntR family transcriptional regulator